MSFPRYALALLLAASATAGPWDAAEKRQQIWRALLVPDVLPALAAEHYGQVEIAPGVIAARHCTVCTRPRWCGTGRRTSGAVRYADL